MSTEHHGAEGVSATLVRASEWTWRLLVVGFGAVVVGRVAAYLAVIVVPLVVAVMICALLDPIRTRLLRRGTSPTLASTGAFAVGLLLIILIMTLAASEFYSNYDELADQTTQGVTKITDWLRDGPIHIDAPALDSGTERLLDRVKSDPQSVLDGTLSVLSTGGELAAGGVLCLIATLFLMKDRTLIWNGVLSAAGPRRGRKVDEAGRAAWAVLINYVKVTLTSAIVDSLCIGVAAAIAGLSVSIALGVVVFIFAFIPTVGAIASGGLVVLVALVTKGPAVAAVLAAVVLVVQQLDANILYPLMASRRLSMHPLASLILVGAGAVVGGIIGAFLAVPLAAVAVSVIATVRGDAELSAGGS